MHAYIPYRDTLARKLLLLLGYEGGKVQRIILAEREEECDRQCIMLKEFSLHLRV